MIKMCKRFYLAYGSNLNIPQMQRRCPTAKIVGVAEIEDYELLFKGSKTGSYLTIEPKKGAMVPVAVWEIKQQGSYLPHQGRESYGKRGRAIPIWWQWPQQRQSQPAPYAAPR